MRLGNYELTLSEEKVAKQFKMECFKWRRQQWDFTIKNTETDAEHHFNIYGGGKATMSELEALRCILLDCTDFLQYMDYEDFFFNGGYCFKPAEAREIYRNLHNNYAKMRLLDFSDAGMEGILTELDDLEQAVYEHDCLSR